MIDVQAVNKRKQRKYIDSYNTEEKKMIDVHAVNKKSKESTQILARCKQKKARFKKKKSKESTQTLTIRKKKMIDVHAVNKKTKKVHKFL